MEVRWNTSPRADNEVNKMVISELSKLYPHHNILGEEESLKKNKSNYVWVCDPIDGTLPYSHGLNLSTFCLALVKDGMPIVGVVSDPFQKLTYSASLHKGTYLNGKRIWVHESSSLKEKIICLEGPEFYGNICKIFLMNSIYPVIFQSFAYGAKMVASGHFIASIFGWSYPWDCAAIKIIVEEAGGRASDYNGNDQRYDKRVNEFIASNGKVHDKIIKIIKKARKYK